MIAAIVLLTLMIPYLIMGVRMSQSRFTELTRQHRKALPTARANQEGFPRNVKEYANKFRIDHESYCYWVYPNLRKEYGCNCPRGRQAFEKASQQIALPPAPSVPYGTIVTWPVHKLTGYITKGADAIPNYDEIERMEREVRRELQ